jgi:lysophospholipase L1-like esterase
MLFKDQKQFFSAFFILAAGALLFYFTKSYLPQKIFIESANSANIVVDSLMLQAMSDADNVEIIMDSVVIVTGYEEAIETHTTSKSLTKNTHSKDSIAKLEKKVSSTSLIQVIDFNYNLEYQADSTGFIAIPAAVPLTSYTGTAHLAGFFEKLYELEQSKEGKVRIAYYGDSMIDGDLIVQDFRSALQNRFGGQGVGFVSIQSESARSRYSVKHNTNGNWKQYNYMKDTADSVLFGVNGAVFYPASSTATVTFLASGIKNSYRLNSPRLFYGFGNKEALLQVTEEKDSVSEYIALNALHSFNSVLISDQNLKKIHLDFSSAQNTPIYGIDFSDATGIAVDGFSNRGNSGLPLNLLNISQMKKFDKALGYDLIILQFGANVLTRKSENYNWYSNSMTKVVRHLQLAFPTADILILGTADKGTKTDAIVKTDTGVVKLLRAQQQYATRTKSSFMSLFHLMGGVNTMPIWTEQKLANNDYTHFSPEGSRKIGRMIYEELMERYSSFEEARTLEIKEEEKKQETTLNQQQTNSLKTQNLKDSISKLPNQ